MMRAFAVVLVKVAEWIVRGGYRLSDFADGLDDRARR